MIAAHYIFINMQTGDKLKDKMMALVCILGLSGKSQFKAIQIYSD